jgi:hypothetical protein
MGRTRGCSSGPRALLYRLDQQHDGLMPGGAQHGSRALTKFEAINSRWGWRQAVGEHVRQLAAIESADSRSTCADCVCSETSRRVLPAYPFGPTNAVYMCLQ